MHVVRSKVKYVFSEPLIDVIIFIPYIMTEFIFI